MTPFGTSLFLGLSLVLVSPAMAEVQDEGEPIVFSVLHGNFASLERLTIAGRLDGHGDFEVILDISEQNGGTSYYVQSPFAQSIAFSLDDRWEVAAIPYVFEPRGGPVSLVIDLEDSEGDCASGLNSYRVSIPLESKDNGRIESKFACRALDEVVVLERE